MIYTNHKAAGITTILFIQDFAHTMSDFTHTIQDFAHTMSGFTHTIQDITHTMSYFALISPRFYSYLNVFLLII